MILLVIKEDLFENPLTVKTYLLIKERLEVGIRETQKALSFKSPSTASWHLNKLLEAQIIKKLPTNRFQFIENGSKVPNIQVPIYFTGYILNGLIISKLIFFLTFIVSMIIFTIYVWIVNKSVILVGINGVLSLLSSLFIILYIWIKFRQEVKRYFPNQL